jgi:dTDP-4-dehydrorhamnose 3,5-epimerase-like enzyme
MKEDGLLTPRIFRVPNYVDVRGSLGVLEFPELMFDCKRVYFLIKSNSNTTRGGHSHPNLNQILICLAGSVKINVKYNEINYTFMLNGGHEALYIPKGSWRKLGEFSEDSIILVLADQRYNDTIYIRD